MIIPSVKDFAHGTSEMRRTDNVHSGQLRPDLSENTDMGAVDHVRFEQLEVGDVGIVPFELTHVFDVLQLAHDKRRVRVTVTVDERQDGMAIFPPVLTSQPTG